MTKQDFFEILHELDITQAEAAKFLSVNIRTLRRWIENPEEIPGPAKQAFAAWRRLQHFGLAWRPSEIDSILSAPNEIAEQFKLFRAHAIHLNTILENVAKRGGPAAPWQVDLKKHVAILGPIRIGFYFLDNGSFSPATYRRTDCEPDLHRDKALIEDACACIAFAIANQKKQTK